MTLPSYPYPVQPVSIPHSHNSGWFSDASIASSGRIVANPDITPVLGNFRVAGEYVQ